MNTGLEQIAAEAWQATNPRILEFRLWMATRIVGRRVGKHGFPLQPKKLMLPFTALSTDVWCDYGNLEQFRFAYS